MMQFLFGKSKFRRDTESTLKDLTGKVDSLTKNVKELTTVMTAFKSSTDEKLETLDGFMERATTRLSKMGEKTLRSVALKMGIGIGLKIIFDEWKSVTETGRPYRYAEKVAREMRKDIESKQIEAQEALQSADETLLELKTDFLGKSNDLESAQKDIKLMTEVIEEHGSRLGKVEHFMEEGVKRVLRDFQERFGSIEAKAIRSQKEMDTHNDTMKQALGLVVNASTRKVMWTLEDVTKSIREGKRSFKSAEFSIAGIRGWYIEILISKKEPASPRVQMTNCNGKHVPAAGLVSLILHVPGELTATFHVTVGPNEAQPAFQFRGVDQTFKAPFEDSGIATFEIPHISTLARAVDVGLDKMVITLDIQGMSSSMLMPMGDGKTLCIRRADPMQLSVLKAIFGAELAGVKRRLSRRVEWKIKQAMDMLRTTKTGEPVHSPSFSFAGLKKVRITLHPHGLCSSEHGAGGSKASKTVDPTQSLASCHVGLLVEGATFVRFRLWIGGFNKIIEHDLSQEANPSSGKMMISRKKVCLCVNEVDCSRDTLTLALEALDISLKEDDVLAEGEAHMNELGQRGTVRFLQSNPKNDVQVLAPYVPSAKSPRGVSTTLPNNHDNIMDILSKTAEAYPSVPPGPKHRTLEQMRKEANSTRTDELYRRQQGESQ